MQYSSLWKSLHRELVTFVHAKVKDRSTAEDIVQDVFIKVHDKSDQLRKADKITSWIFQITRNAVADHFRKTARNIEVTNIDWDTTRHGFNDCVANCLKVLMKTMPDKYRIPLELSELEDLSQYELAQRLNISYSGARSRVQRARKMLRQKLDDLYVIKTDAYGNILVCENKSPCNCAPDS